MKLDLSWNLLCRIVAGRLLSGADGGALLESISIDTRTLSAGQIFWALKGKKLDGHRYLDHAVGRGAAGLVVQDLPQGWAPPEGAAVLQTPDTLAALQRLAAWHIRRNGVRSVGITGSNGKTTTKEMLRAICAAQAPSVACAASYNNEIGLPLTALEILPEHRYAVFEMGASKRGDISLLAGIVKPEGGVITNIAPAHLEYFGSLENVVKTKRELFEALPPEGFAVFNEDDPCLRPLRKTLRQRVVSFGFSEAAELRIEACGPRLVMEISGQILETEILGAAGKTFCLNAAAAAAAAWALGISKEAILAGLKTYQPPPLRMEVRRHPSGAFFLCDYYNANPASVRTALEAFSGGFHGLQKFAILGDMKELGSFSRPYHAELGRILASMPLAGAFLCGEEMKAAWEKITSLGPLPFPLRYAPSPSGWEAELRGEMKEGSAFLFKASRAMEFEKVVEKLWSPPAV